MALLEAPPQGDMRLSVALRAARKAGDTFLEARIHNNRGSRLLERGAYAEAIEELGLAIQLADVDGYESLLALATMNRGLCHWCRGRLEEASADYESALVVYRSIGSSEAAYALIGKGDVHRERGELAQARAAYEEGLAIGEETNDRQALVPGLYQLAKVIVDDEPRRAEQLAKRAVDYGWPDLHWALNALGWVLLARGDHEGAADAAAAAAQAAGELEDPFGIAESLELRSLTVDAPEHRVELLTEALAIWRRLDNVVHAAAVELALARAGSGAAGRRAANRAERRLRALGVRARPTGAAGLVRFVARPTVTPLAIEALGGFRVLADGRPIPRSAWRSKKARDLLQILVSRRGCRVPREALMEALWPEDDPARLPHRLSVAISALRGVLDSARRFAPEHFVSGDRDSVALSLETVAVDVHDFLEEAHAGLLAWREDGSDDARELLLSAEALYRGDFLEEIYDDWPVSLREEARAAYLDVVRALAEDAIATGDPDHAGRLLLRLLERDPFDERAHLGLVRVRIAAGRHGDAQRAYRAYCGRMEQIAVEAAPYPRAAV
jgi:DNA-binding SARP family transcriptional activator